MSEMLNIDWNEKMSNLSVDEKWEKFKNILSEAVEICVPKVTVSRNRKK